MTETTMIRKDLVSRLVIASRRKGLATAVVYGLSRPFARISRG